MDASKKIYFETKGVCCNPYGVHGDAKRITLRHLTDNNLRQLNYSPFTKDMQICDDCRKKLQPGLPTRYHSQTNEELDGAASSSEPMLIDEETDHQHIGQRTARLQAEERIAEVFLSQSSTATDVAPVNEIASTESMREVIIQNNYIIIEQIAGVAGVDKPTLADVIGKNYKSYLRFENDVIQKLRNLFGYSSVPTDLDQVITNIKEKISTIKTEKDKVEFLDLLPDWNKSQIRNTFDNLVTEYTINLMERFNSTTSTNQSGRKPGNQPIHTSTVDRIINFFNQDYISRLFPGMKDVLSVKTANGRVKMQKRLILYPLEDVHKKYNEELEGVELGELIL